MRRSELDFPEKDAGLRADVRALGELLGEVLAEQGGEALLDRVEAARRLAIERRGGVAGAAESLERRLQGLPPAEAEEVVHAFKSYLELVNLAENVHRVRRRRDYILAGSGPQPESLADTMGRLRARGVDHDELLRLLSETLIEPVFTAHPTEVTRRTLLEKNQRVARRLLERLGGGRLPEEERRSLERIRVEVTSAWQTEAHPSERPTVMDELENLLFYVTDVLYPVVPRFYEALEEAVGSHYGRVPEELPTLVRFASWVGADMDGNPNVTAATLSRTLSQHRAQLMQLYRRELEALYRQLSQSQGRVPVSAAVLERIGEYTGAFPRAHRSIPARHRGMPYRVLLQLILARLQASTRNEDRGYRDPEEFIHDLEIIAGSLAAHRGSRAGLFSVRRLLRRTRTFGFHLLTLDVRQDALVHRRALGQALGDAEWQERAPGARAGRLREMLQQDRPPPVEPDPETERTLAVFRSIALGRERFGRDAVGPYIISMARDVDDVLSVLLLARWAGLVAQDGTVPLDVAPLFETREDLEHAGAVMQALLADPLYAGHLRGRGDRQVVMVGYSDSNKDAGLAGSRWAVQCAHAELVRVTGAAGVDLTVFHGRGGTVSRGSGKTDQGVAAGPAGSMRGHLRATEQGELIHQKYGLRPIALRTLEQALSAVVRASEPHHREARIEPGWGEAMQTLADESVRSYRALVHDQAGFVDFFRQLTPIDVIERMRISSRPPSRRKRAGIEDLRAIPWVFAWTQTRLLLPGWYGLGSGIAAAARQHGRDVVREMAGSWPFFRALAGDAEMVLAKSDIAIARRYLDLVDPSLHPLWQGIEAEFGTTLEWLLWLRGNDELLADDPTLQRSIRLRNPYVDPVSLMQVDLLRRWRETGREDHALFHALLETVMGIAQGMRNTG
ncbi:MAG TPA: phosphoenolpyruvate carboxylase [Gammaproteobacteria bacterium]|nr:phosphoenolpyruvate carboxylase [Gammaproteobacteria bacterium]